MSESHPDDEQAISESEVDDDDPLSTKAITETIGPDGIGMGGSIPFPKKSDGTRRPSASGSIKERTSAFSQIMGRRRSNSTVEPSPLAKLFVRSSPTPQSNMQPGWRGHRFSSSASMSQSIPNPMSALSQSLGAHIRANSTSVAGPSAMAQSHRAIVPIHEGKTVSFDPAAKASTSISQSEADEITKASDLEDKEAADSPVAMDDKVELRMKALEEGQKRIEALLQSLVSARMDRGDSGSRGGSRGGSRRGSQGAGEEVEFDEM